MVIHVCPLSCLEATVTGTGARHIVTLINSDTLVRRPTCIIAENHLFLGVSDIVEPLDGHIVPGPDHLDRLLSFVEAWDRAAPLVIHCFAGVSRSTAAAYVAACALDPRRDEMEAALALRAASPTATPNALIVALADARLGRGGRMSEAIRAIGRGSDCYEGTPFEYRI
jgi:predicted protein tyrosine phosphatase